MKRVVIVHCWGGSSNYAWYPETKRELEAKGFEAIVPDMPDTENPKLSLWLPKLKEVIDNPDADLYLVGHSAGCITIMRYLENLNDNQNIAGVVFVAGFTDDLGFQELKNFFETSIDTEKIKTKAKKFAAINSDNDPYVAIKYGDILKEKFNADLIVKHSMGHFSGPIDDEESCVNLPEVANLIIDWAN